MYKSNVSSAAFDDLNRKKVVTLYTELDNFILCSFSNSTGSSAE